MRQRIDLQKVYNGASQVLRRQAAAMPGGPTIPEHCPWTLDQLLQGDPDALLAPLTRSGA